MNLINKKNELIESLTEDDIRGHKDLMIFCELFGIEGVKKILRAMPSGASEVTLPKLTQIDSAVKRFMDKNKSLSQKEIGLILGISRSTISRLKSR
jgi:hypothetical protein